LKVRVRVLVLVLVRVRVRFGFGFEFGFGFWFGWSVGSGAVRPGVHAQGMLPRELLCRSEPTNYRSRLRRGAAARAT
jgi:hypothetical protein